WCYFLLVAPATHQGQVLHTIFSPAGVYRFFGLGDWGSRVQISALRPNSAASCAKISALILRRVDERAIRAQSRRLRHARRLDAVGAENVKDRFLLGDQIIRDNAPVASPPHRLGAHDRAAPFLSQPAQPVEAVPEGRRERVVGIIVKALILPERVEAR